MQDQIYVMVNREGKKKKRYVITRQNIMHKNQQPEAYLRMSQVNGRERERRILPGVIPCTQYTQRGCE